MPNRGELAVPKTRPASAHSANIWATDMRAADAWAVIGFCTIGAVVSLSLAAMHLGFGPIPRLMAQAVFG